MMPRHAWSLGCVGVRQPETCDRQRVESEMATATPTPVPIPAPRPAPNATSSGPSLSPHTCFQRSPEHASRPATCLPANAFPTGWHATTSPMTPPRAIVVHGSRFVSRPRPARVRRITSRERWEMSQAVPGWPRGSSSQCDEFLSRGRDRHGPASLTPRTAEANRRTARRRSVAPRRRSSPAFRAAADWTANTFQRRCC
jgi:hypothetical protein